MHSFKETIEIEDIT